MSKVTLAIIDSRHVIGYIDDKPKYTLTRPERLDYWDLYENTAQGPKFVLSGELERLVIHFSLKYRDDI